MPATTPPLLAQTTAQPVVQARGSDTITVTTINQDLSITWPNPALVSAAAVDLLQDLPTIRYQGYLLPMQLLTVEVEEGQALDLQLSAVHSQILARHGGTGRALGAAGGGVGKTWPIQLLWSRRSRCRRRRFLC